MPESIVPVSFRLAQSDPGAFVAHFAGSFERYGFAVVSDHEPPQALIDGCLGRFKRFLALPEEEKLRYRIPGIGGARGLTPFGVETAKGAALGLWESFDAMGRKRLEAIAVHLGPPQHWFNDKVGAGNSVLRVIHYPPPGTLVCNVGDRLQRLTNHVLPSTTHRGVNPTGARVTTHDRPDRYSEPILADDYLRERLREIKLLH